MRVAAKEARTETAAGATEIAGEEIAAKELEITVAARAIEVLAARGSAAIVVCVVAIVGHAVQDSHSEMARRRSAWSLRQDPRRSRRETASVPHLGPR